MMRVAIIGCGRIARTHLATLRTLPDVEVESLCDPNLPAAGALAERFGVKRVFRSVEAMLEETLPQAVHILTPPETHASLALQALAADCHVLVEKPMATRVADAEAMVTAAKRKGLTLCVDHNRLFDPVVQKARQLVQQGTIGEVVAVESYQGVNRGEGANASEHWSFRSPTGAYYNLAVHPVYLQLAFLEQVRSLSVVSQRTGRFPAVFAEELRVLFEGENTLGYLCFSLDIKPYLNALHIYGTNGTLLLDFNTLTLVRRLPSRLPKLIAKSWGNVSEAIQLVGATAGNAVSMLTGRLSLYPGIGHVIRRFYESLAHGTPPPVSVEEGYEVVRLLEEIRTRATQAEAQGQEAFTQQGAA